MTTKPQLQKTANSRVFLIENMAGPDSVPDYRGFARAMAPDWSNGDRTPVRIPDPNRYGQFITVDFIDGQRGLPTLGIQQRYTQELSDLLAIFRRGCPVDVQIHMGVCEDPSDFDRGWEKCLVLENGRPSNWSTDELGALDADQNAPVNEEVPFTGIDLYEIKRLIPQRVADSLITDEVVDVAICDQVQCAECGIPSNGYSKIFALVNDNSGSPGLPAAVLYSDDGGATWGRTHISTLGLSESPTKMACVGTNLVVISNASNSLHYAPLADILLGTETWTEVSTGFVVAHAPNEIVSLSRTKTWIVGDGGYVYFSDDITAGVEVQTDGSVTTQNLKAIAAFDTQTLVAVGASNAVLFTDNGGATWGAITGPAAGVTLNCVASRGVSANEWLIGTADGKLWYTLNGGDSWTERTFTGSGAGQVTAIVFATPTVGYMAHYTATPNGRVLRTISGGSSWYALPEQNGIMPTVDRFNALGVTPENVNLVFAAGLDDDAADGVIVKCA